MSKKRRREKMEAEAPPTAEQGESEGDKTKLLWLIVTDHPDIFDTHIVTKLSGNDVKFFYDVNGESRAAIKRSGAIASLPSRLEIFTRSRPYHGL